MLLARIRSIAVCRAAHPCAALYPPAAGIRPRPVAAIPTVSLSWTRHVHMQRIRSSPRPAF